MQRSVNNFIILLSALFLSGIVLVESSCRKEAAEYLSEKDFIDDLKGQWCVIQFSYAGQVEILRTDEVLRYFSTVDWITYNYSVDNPEICTLPGIENMGAWTISGDKDNLKLEWKDLCGNSNCYQIQYSNYRYGTHQTYFGYETWVNIIYADINLVDSDTSISLVSFTIDKSTNPDQMFFSVYIDMLPRSFKLNLY